MKILVAGASGYLGARISNHLSLHGYEVIALLRKRPEEQSWQNQMAEIVVGDIRDEFTIQKIVEQKVEAVVFFI